MLECVHVCLRDKIYEWKKLGISKLKLFIIKKKKKVETAFQVKYI